MNIKSFCRLGALLGALLYTGTPSAQSVQLNVTYVCNGERLIITGCNMHDLSDDGKCYIEHPDKARNGISAISYATRGALKQLLPTCQQPSQQEIARTQAFQKKQNELYQAAQEKAEAEASGLNPEQLRARKENAALKECRESGRDETECFGESMAGHFAGMIGTILPEAGAALAEANAPGLYMTGRYKGAGKFTAAFSKDNVAIACNDLEAEAHTYTVKMNGNQALMSVSAKPQPFTLATTADGRLSGPEDITLAGNVIVGYSEVWQTETNPNAADYNIPRSHSVPVTEARTEKCHIGSLTGSSGSGDLAAGLSMGVASGLNGKPIPPGLRVNGQYSGAGSVGIMFHADSAIVRCGTVSVAYDYVVEPSPNQLTVRLRDGARWFDLAYRPDGTLAGSGAMQLNGRRAQSDNFGSQQYTPVSASCAVGVLAPGGAAPASASLTSTAPLAVAAPAAAVATVAAPSGSAVLSLSNGVTGPPGAANPLSGRTFFLLRDSLDAILAKDGFQVPAGVDPYGALLDACRNHAPSCHAASLALQAQTAAGVRIPPAGTATFPGVPPGSYYVMGAGTAAGHVFYWNYRVDLRPGANALTLDQRNSKPVN